MKSSVISFKVDISILRKIEYFVNHGYFKSKSDLIRQALKYKLMKDGLLSESEV